MSVAVRRLQRLNLILHHAAGLILFLVTMVTTNQHITVVVLNQVFNRISCKCVFSKVKRFVQVLC